ncbi:MAG: SurA N-terminal domain-containing protein [Clostridia bacterium]|nr:SurA N-terminal domain-containing protein [Clostridia bacterium]
MKKKTLKTILIAVAVAAVVIAVVVFAILLQKDAHGLNAFERGKVVASVDKYSVTMGEYVSAIDSSLSYYSYFGLTYPEDQLKLLQENTIDELLLQKIYIAKLSELGLSLTPAELAECKTSAEQQLQSLEESIGSQYAKSNNFSSANVQSQINDYFSRALGMTKSQYKARIEEQAKATLALEKIKAYYAEETSNYTEEELLAYYDQYVTDNYGTDYTVGDYSSSMQMFESGYSSLPYLFVPEGFLYVDVVRLTDRTEAEINDLYATLSGNVTFEDLKASEYNTTTMYLAGYDGPYAIGEGDADYVAAYDKLYEAASGLEVGETTLVLEANDNAAEGEEPTYTGYIILRAEGGICENGAANGIVDIDHYAGVRDSIRSNYENSRFTDITDGWLAGKTVDDVIYTYTGSAA